VKAPLGKVDAAAGDASGGHAAGAEFVQQRGAPFRNDGVVALGAHEAAFDQRRA
jgi:hypothetical protein